MTALTVLQNETAARMPEEPLESLVSTYFDKVYQLVDAFAGDPRTSLGVTESVFRTLADRGEASVQALFAHAVQRVRRLQEKSVPFSGVSADSVLCWLVKECSDLRYAEIAELMDMEREAVKRAIAEVRTSLLRHLGN